MAIAVQEGIVRHSVGMSIALSALMIIAGILAILVPPAAGISVAIFVAWLVALSGVFHLGFAWQMRTTGSLLWQLLIGILYLAISLYMLTRPIAGLASLTLVLASYLFVKGILEFVLGVRMRPFPGSGWLFFDGLMAIILGAMIGFTWPSSSEWAIGTLIGVSILFAGISRLSLSLAARRIIPKAL